MVSIISFYPVPLGYFVAWSTDATDPTFRVYVNGRLIATTPQTQLTIPIAPGSFPVIEILDDDSNPTPYYPATVTIGWLAVPGSDHYRIDQGSNTLAEIAEDGSAAYFWQSPPQPDGAATSFKLTPVGTNGNDGTPINFSLLVVHTPDPPQVTYTLNGGLTVTLS